MPFFTGGLYLFIYSACELAAAPEAEAAAAIAEQTVPVGAAQAGVKGELYYAFSEALLKTGAYRVVVLFMKAIHNML